MDSFVLVVTLCGVLTNHTHSCEDFVIEQDVSYAGCMLHVQQITTRQSPLISLINDASNDWFRSISSSSLTCVEEDKQ